MKAKLQLQVECPVCDRPHRGYRNMILETREDGNLFCYICKSVFETPTITLNHLGEATNLNSLIKDADSGVNV